MSLRQLVTRISGFKPIVFILVTLLILNLSSMIGAARYFGKSTIHKKHLFIGCNWKGTCETLREVDDLVRGLNLMWRSLDSKTKSTVEICVYPPYVYMDRVRSELHNDFGVGSQNVLEALRGNGNIDAKNTGTVTPNMLQSVHCDWILLGHSDRRNNLNESDNLIAEKMATIFTTTKMGVTLTIGEKKLQHQLGRTWATLQQQLRVACHSIPIDACWDRLVIAYEPVWAVGEGATPCSPVEAHLVLNQIRHWIREEFGEHAADACRIVYTGSVTPENAATYAGGVDGFVVGRAGMDPVKLKQILQALVEKG